MDRGEQNGAARGERRVEMDVKEEAPLAPSLLLFPPEEEEKVFSECPPMTLCPFCAMRRNRYSKI